MNTGSSLAMRKILVIGGAGFIGTRLCQRLVNSEVPFEIFDLKLSQSFPERSHIVDIRKIEQLRKALAGATPEDIIIHLAAVHRDDVSDFSLYHSTNVEGTKNVCKVATERQIQRIVFASSVAVYGFAPVGTDETAPIAPFNEYGRTKYEAEKVLEHWHQQDKSRNAIFIVRPTVVFGEGNRGNVYNLLNQIATGRFLMVGKGNNRKSMAYVENVAAFFQLATEVSRKHAIVNYVDNPDLDMDALVSMVRERIHGRKGTGPKLPYGLGLSLGYIADLVTKATGRKFPISSIRVKKFCANSSFSSAKNSIEGFTPPVTLEQGILRTLESEFISPDANREVFYTE